MPRKAKPVVWEDGAIVIDANGNIAQKQYGGGGWFVLGWYDQAYDESDLRAPLRRLVPVDETSIHVYRITRHGFGKERTIGSRRQLGATVGYFKTLPERARANGMFRLKIERAVAVAFEDVTDEFLGGPGA